MNDTAHRETNFEAYIVSKLQAQGWRVGTTAGYDTEHALYGADLIEWIQATQPKVWSKLEARLEGSALPEGFKERLGQALASAGTVQVLRNGFSVAGFGTIEASTSKPEDDRNPVDNERYAANILRVVPQLKYRAGHNQAIDLVFFINGLPVATVEVKTDFTQSAASAVAQYKSDRNPLDAATRRAHPLLTFKRGAVVHFAMSDSDIKMTTKLDGDGTYFLPFNKGNNGHAGNKARDDGEYPVAYFWEEVCQPDAWLRIFHDFVYVEKKQVVDLQGNWSQRETLIFPRFHQWNAVNRMINDAKAGGPGRSYLCEHSAGSGKTSTIAWTAHDLIKLRKPEGDSVFHSVIIVTDRNVLDSQLQEAVQQIDHQKGLIAAIDRDTTGESKSVQLARALQNQVPIIVVTIQTFPYAMEAILANASLKDKSFAVIIDEAHNSQTGTAASKLQATLALDSKQDLSGLTVEELLEKIQSSRVRPANISHFAFTATPKHSTMMLFGRPKDPARPAGKDNLPESFDRYPMRQAIEEGFILDVLKGYMPYKTAFNISEQVADTHRVDGRAAKRVLARWMNLHATNVTRKVEFIVEHFAKNVAPLLGNRAKAMVVTSSRAAAVRYKKAFDAYIDEHPDHKHIKALVAFSGKLSGKDVIAASDAADAHQTFMIDEDAEFTESNMNPGSPISDLRVAFDRPEYRVMIVADKFQTGFDQPKLVAMYLDKKIANEVEIVQTLSRLNRTAPGKDVTFVIDFVNDPATIVAAFKKYDAGAQIEKVQDPNVIYTLREGLMASGIITADHLETFKAVRFTPAMLASDPSQQHKALYAATQEPTDTFNEAIKQAREAVQAAEASFNAARQMGNSDGMKKAEHERVAHAERLQALLDFRGGLGRFNQTYNYIAQLLDLGDPSLENFAAFAKLLAKRLDGVPPQDIDVSSLVLTGYDINALDRHEINDKPEPLKPIGPGGGATPAMPLYLREILAKLNSLFGDAAPIEDQAALVNQITQIVKSNATVMAQVERNARDVALKGNLPGAVQGAIARSMDSHMNLASLLLRDDRTALPALNLLIYELLKEGRQIDVDALRG